MGPDASFQPLPWWILLDICLSVWVGTWLLSSTIVAWMMGLRALLARYPPVNEPVEDSFHFASGTLHWVTLNNALYVGIGPRGVHLSPTWFFRSPFYRDIPCIPWSELRCLRFQDGGFIGWAKGSMFEVVSLHLRFSVRGKAGLAVEQKLLALAAGRP